MDTLTCLDDLRYYRGLLGFINERYTEIPNKIHRAIQHAVVAPDIYWDVRDAFLEEGYDLITDPGPWFDLVTLVTEDV